MTRGLPVLLELGLLIFCLIEAIQTPESEIRNLAKVWWIILIIFVPLVGGIAWLVAGRPVSRGRRQVPWPSTRTAGYPEYERPGTQRPRSAPRGPDDDPEYLAQIRQVNSEQESTLKRWEDDLRRREEQLRREGRRPDAEGSDPEAG